MKVTPVLLLILDGFGYREDPDNNAIALAHKPNFDRLWREFPHTLINASESSVGLPRSQMGNSEVGPQHIGDGRLVYQKLSRVDITIKHGPLSQKPDMTD